MYCEKSSTDIHTVCHVWETGGVNVECGKFLKRIIDIGHIRPAGTG